MESLRRISSKEQFGLAKLKLVVQDAAVEDKPAEIIKNTILSNIIEHINGSEYLDV